MRGTGGKVIKSHLLNLLIFSAVNEGGSKERHTLIFQTHPVVQLCAWCSSPHPSPTYLHGPVFSFKDTISLPVADVYSDKAGMTVCTGGDFILLCSSPSLCIQFFFSSREGELSLGFICLLCSLAGPPRHQPPAR